MKIGGRRRKRKKKEEEEGGDGDGAQPQTRLCGERTAPFSRESLGRYNK